MVSSFEVLQLEFLFIVFHAPISLFLIYSC